jgi:hypothetical protein
MRKKIETGTLWIERVGKVQLFKLVTEGTLEEKIAALIARRGCLPY